MATTTTTTAGADALLATPAVTLQGVRVGWGSVWSGFLVATGIFLLLSILGLAIGITAADIGPGQETNAKGLGIGAAAWSGVTLLIALFIGGWTATRTGMVHDRASGTIGGVLVWVLSILAAIYMASSGVGWLSGGVFGTLGSVAQTAVQSTRGFDLGDLGSSDLNRVIAKLEDPKTVQLVATATGTTQDEARAKLGEIRQRIEGARDDPQRAANEAKQSAQELASQAKARAERAAQRAQPYASATMWTTLAVMVVALLAAIIGALVGRRQVERRIGVVMPTAVRVG